MKKIDRAVKSANKAEVLDSVTSNTTIAAVEAKRIQKPTPPSTAEKKLLAKVVTRKSNGGAK